jgi:hypothetical protein
MALVAMRRDSLSKALLKSARKNSDHGIMVNALLVPRL